MSKNLKNKVKQNMIHDLVHDGLDYKSAKKLVNNFGGDPIVFNIMYNDAIAKLGAPPVFHIKSTYMMSMCQSEQITQTTFG